MESPSPGGLRFKRGIERGIDAIPPLNQNDCEQARTSLPWILSPDSQMLLCNLASPSSKPTT
jgi:hypothetical protein